MKASTQRVLDDVAAERTRQDAKFPHQRNVDGTGPTSWAQRHIPLASTVRQRVEQLAAQGRLDDATVLLEEVAEALEEVLPGKLRAELVQVAAVAVRWVERLDEEAGERGERLAGPKRLALERLTESYVRSEELFRLRATVAHLERELLDARQRAMNLVARLDQGADLRSAAYEDERAYVRGWSNWLSAHGHLWRDNALSNHRPLAVAAIDVREADVVLTVALAKLATQVAIARRRGFTDDDRAALELLRR